MILIIQNHQDIIFTYIVLNIIIIIFIVQTVTPFRLPESVPF